MFRSNKSNKRSHSHAQLIACATGTYQHVEIGVGLAAFPQSAETGCQTGTWSACNMLHNFSSLSSSSSLATGACYDYGLHAAFNEVLRKVVLR